MAGIIDRRDSGAWVPRDQEGRYEPASTDKGIEAVHGGGVESVVHPGTDLADQPKVETIGDPTPAKRAPDVDAAAPAPEGGVTEHTAGAPVSQINRRETAPPPE